MRTSEMGSKLETLSHSVILCGDRASKNKNIFKVDCGKGKETRLSSPIPTVYWGHYPFAWRKI